MGRFTFALFLCVVSSSVFGAARPRNVAIIVHNGAEVLDFAGPAEVLQAAGGIASENGTRALKLYTVGITHDPIVSQGFIRVTPEFSIEDAPKPDVIVIPGGGTGSLLGNPAMMAWLAKVSADAEVTLTVCTGAFPIAKLGVLDGKEITTWYGAIARLQDFAPNTMVKNGRRFVDNGKYITTAGVSAGIDGSLHLVARLLGRRVADQTARYMEYHWSPEPYLTASYEYWNPSTDDRGRAMQQVYMAAAEERWADAMPLLRNIVKENPEDGEAWNALGQALSETGDQKASVDAYLHVPESSSFRSGALYAVARDFATHGDEASGRRYLVQAIDAGFSRQVAMQDPALESIRDAIAPDSAPKQ